MQLDMFGGQVPARNVRMLPPAQTKSSATFTATQGDVWSRLTSIIGTGTSTAKALEHAAVLICLDVLSQDIAKARPLLHVREGDQKRIVRPEEHPVAEMFALDPNRRHTWFEFSTMTALNLGLIDNAYIAVERQMDGTPLELLPISPGNQKEKINTRTFEVFYDVKATNHQEMALLRARLKTYAEMDMIHVRKRMWDGFWGYPTIKAGSQTIEIGRNMDNWQERSYAEDAILRGVFLRDKPSPMSEEAATALRRQARSLMKKVRSEGEPVVLEDGMSWQSLEDKASDKEVAKALDAAIAAICRLFRVPQHKALHLNAVKYENLVVMERMYVRDTLIPIATAVEERMERSLLSKRDRLKYSIRYDREALTLDDEELKTKRTETLVKFGIISRNEARETHGYNPKDGLDEATPMVPLPQSTEGEQPAAERGLQVIEGGKGA